MTPQEQIEKLREALERAVKVAGEARDEWDRAPAGMKAGKLLIALSGNLSGYRRDIDAIHAALALTTSEPDAGGVLAPTLDDLWTAVRNRDADISRLTRELLTVLEREAATTARYDAKLDAAEARILAAKRLAAVDLTEKDQ
jgi:hypothetical protein